MAPRLSVKSEWNADKSGSIVTCTWPDCDRPRREYTGPKVIGDDDAKYHRHAHQRAAAQAA